MDSIYLSWSSGTSEAPSKQLEHKLGIADDSAEKVAAFITSSKLLDKWTSTKSKMPNVPPGTLGLLIPETRYNLNCDRIWIDIIQMFLGLSMSSIPQDLIAGAFRILVDRLRKLSDSEIASLGMLKLLSMNYGEPIARKRIDDIYNRRLDIAKTEDSSNSKVTAQRDLESLRAKKCIEIRSDGSVQICK